LQENNLTKHLQAEVRELRQKCEELSAQLPDFEARRQAEADAVQTKLKCLISKLDNNRSDVPDRNAKSSMSSMQRSTSPRRNVQFSEVVEHREIEAKTVDSCQEGTQAAKPETTGPVTGVDTMPEQSDKLSKAIQRLKDDNFRQREESVEFRESAAGIQRLQRAGARGVYRSTSAEDVPRLLGRLGQQGSPKCQSPAVSKTGVVRQQSSDTSFVTQVSAGIAQRATPFAASPSLQRHALARR